MWLFVLFLTVPLIEIALFIQIGGLIGLWPTLLIVVLTAILGTWLVRRQGLAAIGELRRNMNELRDPSRSLAHGAMILVSGALLLTPGFFTDAIGFALLVPQVRDWIISQLARRVRVETFEYGTGGTARGRTVYPDDDTIDGEYSEIDPDPRPLPGRPSGWTRH